MSMTKMISNELVKYRTKTTNTPKLIKLSTQQYEMLVSELKHLSDMEITEPLEYFYGIPIKVSDRIFGLTIE